MAITKPSPTDKVCIGTPSIAEAMAFFENLTQYYNQETDASLKSAAAFSGLAANKHFIGNAAGDGAEWAVPYKAGYFTRDMSTASGTQAISGLGFKPSLIIFFGASDGSGAGQASFGYAAGAVQNAIFYRLSDKTWTLRENVCAEYDTNGTDIYTGKVNSYDTDGFTIGWTKYASKVGNAYTNWIAFR